MKAPLFLAWVGTIAVAVCGDQLPNPSPSELAVVETARTVESGPAVFGVFRGRTPCQELSSQLGVPASEACNKVKCRLVLYQDPKTKEPTTYQWTGKAKWSGRWSILTGTPSDPRAIVYKLEPPEAKAFLSFLKVDENILFFLGRDGTPLVGNWEFSYTLNRILKE